MAHRDATVEKQALALERQPVKYSSKLMGALSRFASALSNEVRNPLLEKYGDAYDLVIQGDAHRLREEFEPAIRAYERAIAMNPEYPEAYIGMGHAFRRKG
ncbi:MAG: tetratricopeptide repeat protein, partial [Vampirovibrionales bacterium]